RDLRPVSLTELPQPDENRAALFRGGDVRRPRGIAEVGPGRVVAVLVLKDALPDQKLLSTPLRMTREGAATRGAPPRRGASDFTANAKQHAPVYAGRRTGDPIHFRGMNEDRLC